MVRFIDPVIHGFRVGSPAFFSACMSGNLPAWRKRVIVFSFSIKPDLTIGYSANDATISGGSELIPFFGIGMVINLVVFVAFLIWAINHWNKK